MRENSSRAAPRRVMRFAPCGETIQDRPQGLALFGQNVVALSSSILFAPEHPRIDKLGQARAECRFGDVKVIEEIVEAGHPQKAVANYKHGPSLAYKFERACDRAILLIVVLRQRHEARSSLQKSRTPRGYVTYHRREPACHRRTWRSKLSEPGYFVPHIAEFRAKIEDRSCQ